MKNVLVIGGHGMLGRPVVRILVKEGFTVRAMARSVEKAQELLPDSVEVVKGDLEDVESIRKAADSMDIVYMNVDTPDPYASFKADLDGPKNVIEALADRPEVVLAKISGYGVEDTHGWWPVADVKFQGEALIRESGHPYLIFYPTWFMESLPLLQNGNTAFLFGNNWNPLYFLAGDDYGRMVAVALKNPDIRNRSFDVQGLEALDFEQAMQRFAAEVDKAELKKKKLRVVHVPLCLPGILGTCIPFAKNLHRLFTLAKREHAFTSQEAWDELGKPVMKIEDYVQYMKETGDVPSK